MPIDWSSPLVTSHEPPRAATLIEGRGPGDRRRVLVLGDFGMDLVERGGQPWPTVFLYDESGSCDLSDERSAFCLVNAAA